MDYGGGDHYVADCIWHILRMATWPQGPESVSARMGSIILSYNALCESK